MSRTAGIVLTAASALGGSAAVRPAAAEALSPDPIQHTLSTAELGMTSFRSAPGFTPPGASEAAAQLYQGPAPAEEYPLLTQLGRGELRDGRTWLRFGDRGEDVRELQRLLAAAGFDPGKADGSCGARTVRAVRTAQEDLGVLPVDGKAGTKTITALMQRLGAPAGAQPGTEATARSPETVATCQRLLNEQLGAGLNPDGRLGEQTRFAVAAYQLTRGLSATGDLDSATVQALTAHHPATSGGLNHELLPRVPAQQGFIRGTPVTFEGRRFGDFVMQDRTAEQFVKLFEHGLREGIFLQVNSAFRTNEEQARLFRAWQSGESRFIAAAPGRSNHQSGIALDINVGGFSGEIYRWMEAKAPQYGFIRTVHGANAEAHHWEYRGPGSTIVDPRFRDGVR